VPTPAPRIGAWAAALLAAAVLAACTTTSSTTTAPIAASPGDAAPAPQAGDAARRARVRMELAAAYFGRGQLPTALEEVKLAIAADPDHAPAWNLRGLIHGSLGDDAQAEDSFRQALRLDARDPDAMQNYGWFLCQQRRYEEAGALFRQALDVPRYRDAPRTLLTAGICQARAGQWSEAESTLTRSYELDPANPAIAVNLSEVLYRRGELERARFHIRRVNASADLVNAQTLWLAARIENRLGNRQGAQEFGTQLRSRFPDSPEAGAFARGRFDE
jgi:type IV pilus assembly protein PilF